MALTHQQIDEIVDSLYGRKSGGGELPQLARLFSRRFWKLFKDLLEKEFAHRAGPYQQEIRVGLGYIDKIPVAHFVQPVDDIHGRPIDEKTELGDAAFFFVDLKHVKGQWTRDPFARGLILQAKQAKSGGLPKVVPMVPLPGNTPATVNDSTLKELALLSAWPPFDLYFTAGSNAFLQKGYEVAQPGKAVQPQAWYIGASPKVRTPWSPRWIAGPSSNGAPCDATVGMLLHAILQNRGKLNGVDCVGADFDFDAARLASSTYQLANNATPPNWTDLCHQIMLVCNAYKWPKMLFGNVAGKRGAGVSVLYASPLGPVFELIRRMFRWRLGTIPRGSFPVIVVVRVSGEGPSPSFLPN